jgi:thymidine kinase
VPKEKLAFKEYEMERYRHPKTGMVEVICGPMFSGKTEELIRRLRRAKIARQRVVVFKPRVDNRYDEVQIVSHSAQRIPSIPVEDPLAMEHCLKQLSFPVDVVGIDEAQFFDSTLVSFVEDLADRGVRVVVAGLDQDYQGQPFGPMPNLLAISDVVTKQYAICVVCTAPASRTQRIFANGNVPGNEQVLVGALEAYEARCRGCHVPEVDKPASQYLEADAFTPAALKVAKEQETEC